MKVKVRLKGGIVMDTVITGRFISELRKEKGLTQAALAEKLNVTDKAVSKWETGRSAPDVSLLIPLSEILCITVTEILKGERISAEVLSDVSNEVIVKAIKDKNQISKKLLLIAGIIMSVLILITASGLVCHYYSSVPADDTAAILKQSEKYAMVLEEVEEEMKIIKKAKRGPLYAYLLQSENKTSLRIFKADPIFRHRFRVVDALVCEKPGEIFVYNGVYGDYKLAVFYGYDISDTNYGYSFTFHGKKYTLRNRPVKDEVLLDVRLSSGGESDIVLEK